MSSMVGGATLWIKNVEGEVQERAPGLTESAADHEKQVIILHVQAADATINIVFRRGEFSALCANPNDPEAEVEVAVNIELEEQDERDDDGNGAA